MIRRAELISALALLLATGPALGESFDCVIEPSQVLKLGSPVSSTLRSVSVNRGDVVRAGQEVARLVSGVEEASVALDAARADSSADVSQKQVKLSLAQTELNRGLGLQVGASIPQQKLDQLRSDVLVAQQDLALAQLDHQIAGLTLQHSRALLEQRTIRSPIAGIVTERPMGPGEYVREESAIVVLASIDPLYVETFPPVRYWRALRPGQAATVEPDAAIGGSYPAKVLVVDHVLDAASGTFGVRLELANPGGRIPAGVRCKVTMVLNPVPAETTDAGTAAAR